jgi:endonuclease/exonuclease/phosphatase family metal-dependent hydrolase
VTSDLDPTAPARPGEILLATWNVEALFDTQKDAGKLDDEYLPHGWYAWTEEKLARKIANLGRVIRAIGGGRGPDVLALEEVENLGIVRRLRDEALSDLGYETIVHFDTEDAHGLDNAILSRFPVALTPVLHETSRFGVDRDRLPRGILDTTLDVRGVHLIVFVNHWPAGPKAEGQRMHVASKLRALIEARMAADPGAEVVAVGDFNVGPADRALGERGLRATVDARAARAPGGGAVRLYNTMAANVAGVADANALELLVKDPKSGLGTHFTRPYPYTGPAGEWNAFDQVFVSAGLLDDLGLSWVEGSTRVMREGFMLEEDGTPRGFFERGVKPRNQELERTGFSDHLPVVTRLRGRG